MPTFMDSLAANPSGKSGVYGQGSGDITDQTLSIVNKLKDREAADFKDKATFMANLSAQQPRLERLYAPNQNTMAGGLPQQGQNNQAAPPVRDPNAMNAQQQAEMGFKQQQLAQQGKLGQEALDVKTKQETLNQQKSDQIHQQKIDELTAKQNDFKQKLDLATKALTDKSKSADEQLALHKTIAENTKAFHDAEMARKDLEFNRMHDQMQDKIDLQTKQLNQRGNSSTTTTLSDDGKSKTSTTTRGSTPEWVKVNGPRTKERPDGVYEIPPNKVDDWNANHADQPHQIPPLAVRGPQADQANADDKDVSSNGQN